MNATSQSPGDAMENDPEHLARKAYLEGLNSDYEAFRDDHAAWTDFRAEIAEWDVTNEDGLEHA
jgi:deoxyadenosine/deoxycytidine kinase